jgi:hypothetical protein
MTAEFEAWARETYKCERCVSLVLQAQEDAERLAALEEELYRMKAGLDAAKKSLGYARRAAARTLRDAADSLVKKAELVEQR